MTSKRFRDLTPRQQFWLLTGITVQVSLAATAWVDLWRRPAAQVNGPKAKWAAIIALNFVGPLAYFARGRNTGCCDDR